MNKNKERQWNLWNKNLSDAKKNMKNMNYQYPSQNVLSWKSSNQLLNCH